MTEYRQDGAVTKEELANFLRDQHNLPLATCLEIVDQFFIEAREVIIQHNKLVLTNFGSFKKVSKSARPGHNFKDNKPVTVAARDVVTFAASAKMRQKLNIDIVNSTVHIATTPVSKEQNIAKPGAFHSAVTQFISDKGVSHSNINGSIDPGGRAPAIVKQDQSQGVATSTAMRKRVDILLNKIYTEKQYVTSLLQ